jgi:hypothetical protein
MENHNKQETVVVDNKPYDVRISRFPIHPNSTHTNKSAVNSNRYLQHQASRIQAALSEGKVEKAVLIWLCLIKTSRAYQTLCYVKCRKQWYIKHDASKVRQELIQVMNKCRKFDLTMDLKRFYIQKPNGKYRPIGSPTIASKVIAKMLTDMWVTISEPHRSRMQHAYRPNKGTWSAIMDVIAKIDQMKEGDEIYEFDLKGFFNSVNRHNIHEAGLRYSKLLANCIRNIVDFTRYTFGELLQESELIKVDYKHWKAKNKQAIYRSGMPQGLPLSPLAATIALENVIEMPELTLYADDGILVGGKNKFQEFVRKSIEVGAEIAPEKTKIVKDNFKFLGVIIDIKNRRVVTDESWISWDDKGLENWLRKHSSMYSKVPEQWDWEVDGGSFIKKHEVFLGDIGLWKWVMVKVLGKEFKGLKYTGSGGIYYVQSSSSECSEDLLKESVAYKLGKIFPFRWHFRKYAESYKKSQYIELGTDWNGWYNANKMNWDLQNIWGDLHN